MEAPRIVGVLDVGKTNVKLLLHDLETDTPLASRTTPNSVVDDGPYPHFDVAAIQAFCLDGLADLLRERIAVPAALVVTTHGASGALIGADDLVLPVLDYECPGPDDLAEDYDRVRPGFAETCSPRLPAGLNLGAQLFWQAKRFPAAFAQTRAIVTYPQYWAWWLSGIASVEASSLGAHTDLWDPRSGVLSSLPARVGFAHIMAPLRRAWDELGPVRPAIATRLGLDRPVPVLAGIHDSNASLLPHRLAGASRLAGAGGLTGESAPMTVVSTGTWVIVFSLGGSLDGLDPSRDMLANVDIFGQAVPSARFMAGREFDLIAGAGDHPEPRPDAVSRLIATRIMVLPSLVPGAGPLGRAKGGWSPEGAETELDPAERVAVASLYAGLVTAACLDDLRVQGPTLVEGPFSRNALFIEVLEALTRRPVLLPDAMGGSAAGAALLMSVGRGLAAKPPKTRRLSPRYGLGDGFRRYADTWLQRASAGAPPRGA